MDKVPSYEQEGLNDRLIQALGSGRLDEVRDILRLMDSDQVVRELRNDLYVTAFDNCTNTDFLNLLLDTALTKPLEAEDIERAMDHAIELDRVDLVKQLLQRGANVEGWDGDEIRWPRLSRALEAENLEIARCLIEAGADVNFFGVCDTTPLMVAGAKGDLASVRLLLDHGANPCNPTTDQEGWSLLMHACHGGNADVVRLLIEKYSFDYLFGTTSHSGKSVLMVAVENGHHGVVRLLLEKGADVQHQNNRGETALALAEKRGDPSLVELLEQYSAT